MQGLVKRTIPVSSELSIVLYEHIDPQQQRSYVLIQQNNPRQNMEGKAIVAPNQIPDLIKALTEASIELTQSSSWRTGYNNGFRAALKNQSPAEESEIDFAD